MGMLLSSVSALATFYPDAKQIDDPEERYMAAIRLIAKIDVGAGQFDAAVAVVSLRPVVTDTTTGRCARRWRTAR